MFKQAIKRIPPTEKQLNCIEVMHDIISKELDFTEEELKKREKFLIDYEEVHKAIRLGLFTISLANYIISKWMPFSYEIRNKYLCVEYQDGGFDDRDEWDFIAHIERF